jgi:FlaA1/EpsC-like NDP-sugar epimerase
MKVTDIALAVAPEAKQEIVGIRPGEKLHEQMIGREDAPHTYEYQSYFKILPAIHNWSLDPERIKNGILVNPSFTYNSDNNNQWMAVDELRNWIKENSAHIGKI